MVYESAKRNRKKVEKKESETISQCAPREMSKRKKAY